MWTGRLVLLLVVAPLGCGSSRPPGVTTSTSPGPGCTVSGACNTASDGGETSAGGTTWLAAFEAGSHTNETLWLLPVDGDPVRVIDVGAPPPSVGVVSQSTFGYDETSGHVGHVVFDPRLQQLWVGVADGGRHDVQRLDLATGRWETVATSDDVPLIDSTARGPIVVTQVDGRTEIFAARGGELALAFAAPGVPPLYPGDVQRYELGGTEYLYVEDVIYGKLDDERFVPATFPEGFPAAGIDVAPDGTRICSVWPVEEYADSPPSGQVWLIDDGGARGFDVPSSGALECSFTRDGQVVVVQSRLRNRTTTFLFDPGGDVLADLADADIQVSDDTHGYFTVGTDVFRIEWDTLDVTTLAQFADTAVLARSQLWLLDGALLVERYTGCIDCHSSGLWLVPLDGTEPEEVLEARERSLLQVAVLADGTALIAHSDNDGDTLRRVHPDGQVTDVGPFDAIDALPHAPVAL